MDKVNPSSLVIATEELVKQGKHVAEVSAAAVHPTSQGAVPQWVKEACCLLDAHHAEDIRVLNLRALGHAVADYFVLATARNTLHLDALWKMLNKKLQMHGEGIQPWFVEGKAQQGWIVMDYVKVVLHLFIASVRTRYALEDLWADAPMLAGKDCMPASDGYKDF